MPKKIPDCPECRKPLKTIHVKSEGEHLWWEKKGYEWDDAQVSLTYVCGECGKDIGGWRSDGGSWGFVPSSHMQV